MQSEPITKRLVLVGAGHAHIIVLHRFAMRPVPGLEIVLVSDTAYAPYSGMIPGYLMKRYSFEDLHFDLEKLCSQPNFRFVSGKVDQISLKEKWIKYNQDKNLVFDYVSIDIGIEPSFTGITIQSGTQVEFKTVTTLKPISKLIPKMEEIFLKPNSKLSISVIGAGASGFEVAQALKVRLPRADIHLFGSKSLPLEGHSKSVQKSAYNSLKKNSISFVSNARITEIEEGSLKYVENLSDQSQERTFQFDHCFLATNAKAFAWLKQTDLPLNNAGFIRVESNLQIAGYHFAFAAGDCVSFQVSKSNFLPKAGVYAVRQGPILADNLRTVILSPKKSSGFISKLRKYRPQKTALALLVCGPSHALLSKGTIFSFLFKSPLFQKILFEWKDSIDRTFMIRFQNIAMQSMLTSNKPFEVTDAKPFSGESSISSKKTYCLGCGSKVPKYELNRIIHELRHKPLSKDGFLSEMWSDDASPIDVASGFQQFVTVDGMAIFCSDPELGARALFSHAANDLLSMGLNPKAFTIDVILSDRAPHLRVERLLEIMRGIEQGALPFNAKLLNAHSRESNSSHDHISLTLISELHETRNTSGSGASSNTHGILRKGPIIPKLRLILTKPLGTGIALRAWMLGLLTGKEIQKLKEYFNQDHSAYLPVLKNPNVKFATDVSGFGLHVHLSEMLEGSLAKAEIEHVPYFDFVDRVVRENSGVIPQLLIENQSSILSTEETLNKVANSSFKRPHPVCFDPTTNGPLLIAIDEKYVVEVFGQLSQAGLCFYDIGRTT